MKRFVKGLTTIRVGLFAGIFAMALGAGFTPAHAAQPTPQQIQTMIATGHPAAALADLRIALREHPHSGVAWYLKAEAEDATGHAAAARDALSRAEVYAPGLPFADPGRVAALQAHLAAAPRTAAGSAFGHPALLVLGGLVILFLLMRWYGHSRRVVNQPYYPNNFGYGPNGVPPGGAPPYSGPAGGGFAAGGMGSSLLTGLAAGAGFAAGERIIDGFAGGRGERMIDPSSDPGAMPPDRDDGLTGAPGWDDGSSIGDTDLPGSGADFDPDNSW